MHVYFKHNLIISNIEGQKCLCHIIRIMINKALSYTYKSTVFHS